MSAMGAQRLEHMAWKTLRNFTGHCMRVETQASSQEPGAGEKEEMQRGTREYDIPFGNVPADASAQSTSVR